MSISIERSSCERPAFSRSARNAAPAARSSSFCLLIEGSPPLNRLRFGCFLGRLFKLSPLEQLLEFREIKGRFPEVCDCMTVRAQRHQISDRINNVRGPKLRYRNGMVDVNEAFSIGTISLSEVK